MNKCYIYRHIRLDKNQVFYVGIGTKEKSFNGPGREYHRAYSRRRRSDYWNNVVSKTDYEVEIVIEDLTVEQAKSKEKEFIALYKRVRKGGTLVNLTDGGDGSWGYEYTEEHRKKISIVTRGRKHTEESKKLMSLKAMGNSGGGKEVLDTETNLTYPSALACARVLNIHPSTIAYRIRVGIRFKYKKNLKGPNRTYMDEIICV